MVYKNFMPTYLKYKYILSSFRLKVGSGFFFFSWAGSVSREINDGSSSLILYRCHLPSKCMKKQADNSTQSATQPVVQKTHSSAHQKQQQHQNSQNKGKKRKWNKFKGMPNKKQKRGWYVCLFSEYDRQTCKTAVIYQL